VAAGRYDFNVSSQVASEWFAKVKAPSKRFVWFENSAHLPMTEEPGKFFDLFGTLHPADRGTSQINRR
jgi:pimeloyl-ACP methyl ester carboxylesterase